MSALVVVQQLRQKYFEPQGFGVRASDGSPPFPWVLVQVAKPSKASRVFGLRFVDYPLAPPTLRFWLPARWSEEGFTFDFSSTGDAGAGTTTSNLGVPTMCIPYHVDYYRDGWHTDNPWSSDMADVYVSELVHNVLKRC